MKNRIFTFIESKQITPTEFANVIGVSPAAISSIKTGRTQPTLSLVEKIKQYYPEVDVNWLIFGKGEMLTNDIVNSIEIKCLDDSKREDEVVSVEQPNVVTQEICIEHQKKQFTEENRIRKVKRIVIFYTDGTFDEFEK